ncbi:CrpP-related protein [Achromobacter xylosoxidans]|uniref:Uncharacterized protein n=1 Tax=Alcaligenes xylosoxydans xylosoxydans TaxID=85698 RepID=A0A2L0PTL3_ALCXX|nr:hypothetical protein AL504_31435 [Achromobacter xylosoxidans]
MPRDDIQKLGAKAAREGLTLFDCPYFLSKALPGYTGESILSWKQKVDAWELGWRDEIECRLARADPDSLVNIIRRRH